jgi:hypothetical protein
MKISHLELLKLLIDDLRYAGAPDPALSSLTLLYEEQQKQDPGWFNSAQNFGGATEKALEIQQGVLTELGQPCAWGLSKEDELFPDTVISEERWRITAKMRSVAAVASRLGKRGVKPAIGLLRMSLNPSNLGPKDLGGAAPGSVSADAGGLRQRIRDSMENAIDQAFGRVRDCLPLQEELSAADLATARGALRVAYFVLHERVVQPWPPLLMQLLSDANALSSRILSSRILQPAFIEMLKSEFKDLIQSPFSANAPVLFWQKTEEKWEEGRVLATDPMRIVCKDQVIRGLEPKHVLSHTIAGVGSLMLEAARQGHSRLVKLLLDARVSPFFSDRDANTALILAARSEEKGCEQVCKELVQGGANENVFNKFRVNAYDVAVMRRHTPTLQALKPSKSSDLKKMTPLMYATHLGGLKMVQPLLDAGVDLKEATELGASAITIAAEEGHVDVLEWLLARDRELVNDGRYDKGRTPLLLAAQNGHSDAVRCVACTSMMLLDAATFCLV